MGPRLGSPPIVVDARRDGETIPAVIQLVKTGMVFIFNRETGGPLFPIEERPVPTDSDIEGEQLSLAQPFPTKPPVLVRNSISPDDAWGFTIFDRNACRKKIASMRHGGHYEPPMTTGTIMFPQPGGGSNWGGGAFDPGRNLLVTPVSQIPYYIKLIPRSEVDPEYASGRRRRPCRASYRQSLRHPAGPLMSPSSRPAPRRRGTCWWPWTWSKARLGGRSPAVSADARPPLNTPAPRAARSSRRAVSSSHRRDADNRLHAYDIDTGEELYPQAPTSAMSTLMTHEADGRQFVFTAGGHSWSTTRASTTTSSPFSFRGRSERPASGPFTRP